MIETFLKPQRRRKDNIIFFFIVVFINLKTLLCENLIDDGSSSSSSRQDQSSPFAVHSEKCKAGILIAGHMDGRLVAIDAWTGAIKWSFDSGSPLTYSTSSFSNTPNHPQKCIEGDEECYRAATAAAENSNLNSIQYQYIPGLDGQIYSLSSTGNLEQLSPSLRELAAASGPVSSTHGHLSNYFLVGRKTTTLYSVDLDTGRIELVKADDSKSSSSTMAESSKFVYVGRNQYSSDAISANNGSVSWSIGVGEFFIHSHHESTCSSSSNDLFHEKDNTPSMPVLSCDHSSQSSHLVARHPDSKVVLWEWNLPSIVVSIHGISTTGNVFFKHIFTGPSKNAANLVLTSGKSTTSETSPEDYSNAVSVIVQGEKENQQGLLDYTLLQQVGTAGNQLIVLPLPAKVNHDTSSTTQSPALPLPNFTPVLPNPLLPAKPRHSHVTPHGLFVSWRLICSIVVGLVGVLFICFDRIKQIRKVIKDHRRGNSTELPSSPQFGKTMSSLLESKRDSKTLLNSPAFPRSVSLGALPRSSDGLLSPSASLKKSDSSISPETEEFLNTASFGGTKGVHVSVGRFQHEFENLESLGKGGFGTVVCAQNLLDGRKYAIKKIATHLSDHRALDEVRFLAKFDHRNIVRYYQTWVEKMTLEEQQEWVTANSDNDSYDMMNSDDSSNTTITNGRRMEVSQDSLILPFEESEGDNELGSAFEWEGEQSKSKSRGLKSTQQHHRKHQRKHHRPVQDHWLFIQMQYCSKHSLSDYLSNTQRDYDTIDLRHVLRMVHQIASGLAYCHDKGMMHRDLKPANILVMDDSYEDIKLADFGLSRYVSGNSAIAVLDKVSPAKKHTMISSDSGTNTKGVGTMLYASPEQINGRSYDGKTDVFSLGLILLELCSPKFTTSMERFSVLSSARKGQFNPKLLLSTKDTNADSVITKELGIMIRKLLSIQPRLRPSASEVESWSEALLNYNKSGGPTISLPSDVVPSTRVRCFHIIASANTESGYLYNELINVIQTRYDVGIGNVSMHTIIGNDEKSLPVIDIVLSAKNNETNKETDNLFNRIKHDLVTNVKGISSVEINYYDRDNSPK